MTLLVGTILVVLMTRRVSFSAVVLPEEQPSVDIGMSCGGVLSCRAPWEIHVTRTNANSALTRAACEKEYILACLVFHLIAQVSQCIYGHPLYYDFSVITILHFMLLRAIHLDINYGL